MSKIKQQQTFLQKTYRYLFPIFLERVITLRTLIIYSIWWINPIIHVIFIQKIVSIFEIGTRQDFIEVTMYYVLYNVVYEFLDFSMKRWWWVENINAYRKKVDEKYIQKYITTDNNEIEKQWTGKLISIITNGSDIWALSLDSFILQLTKIIFIFIYSFYMFLQVGVLYAWLFILIYLLVLWLGTFFNAKSLSTRRERIQLYNHYLRKFVKILMSKLEIMQSWKIVSEIKSMSDVCDEIIEVNKRDAIWVYACYRTAEAAVLWIKVWILFYVGLWYFAGDFTLSFFVWLFAVMSLLESTVTQSMKFFRNFTKDFTKIEQLWDFFDTTPQIQWYDTGGKFIHKDWDISLKNIAYAYDEELRVFDKFSLDIEWWKVTAFVWPSGGGKSTLVKLISGYIRQDSWDIIVDKQKLSEVSLKSYYGDIGYLTQEPSVFDGTIKENLLYALSEKTSKEDIEKSIQMAHCEFIYDLKGGINTEIGERGIKLSWGQKQRLAIAKIFLKNPKIIILDEPTSALDSLSEQKITEAMHNLFKWRTVLVIAHRLQTVKHADKIVVIEWGKIIEEGTHTSLTKKKGFYKQMIDLQSGF